MSSVYDVIRMMWFASGAIGVVELLRFFQRRFSLLREPWPQGLMFGTVFAVILTELGYLAGIIDLKEMALVVPFLGMLAGGEGVFAGAALMVVAMPRDAVLVAAPAATALILMRLGRSPLPSLAVAWVWIGLQGPIAGLLHGRLLHPAIDIAVSAAGAVALYAYVAEVDRRQRDLLQAQRRSSLDPLTGLLSRSGLQEWLASHQRQRGALIMMDIDDFKSINELYGHLSGDAVLQQAAARFRSCVGPADALARQGGDEFVTVLPDADVQRALTVARHMLDRLGGEDVRIAKGSARLMASFGIAVGRVDECQSLADAALLRAKAEGKGRVVVHGGYPVPDDREGQLLRVTSFARELLFHMPLGVVMADASLRIVAASSRYASLAGLADHRRIVDRPGADAPDGGLVRWLSVEAASHLQRNGEWRGQTVDRRPDGSVWWADWSIASVDVRGQRLGYLGIVSDATAAHRDQALMLAEAIGLLAGRSDPSTRGHLRRVRRYMELLTERWLSTFGGGALECNPQEYGLAAMMHDVGKLFVPAAILAKPGPLTAAERAIVNRHPVEGARYLQQLYDRWCLGAHDAYMHLFLKMSIDLSLSHHERVDGTGYPYGVAGADIPLVGRLFAVVDVYDALQDRRPYKEPWTEEAAFSYLEQHGGAGFDRGVVQVVAALREEVEWRAVRGVGRRMPAPDRVGETP